VEASEALTEAEVEPEVEASETLTEAEEVETVTEEEVIEATPEGEPSLEDDPEPVEDPKEE